jgi:hypothetical protein
MRGTSTPFTTGTHHRRTSLVMSMRLLTSLAWRSPLTRCPSGVPGYHRWPSEGLRGTALIGVGMGVSVVLVGGVDAVESCYGADREGRVEWV